MGDLLKVIGILVASSFFLLGVATFIQILEQMIREPGGGGPRS